MRIGSQGIETNMQKTMSKVATAIPTVRADSTEKTVDNKKPIVEVKQTISTEENSKDAISKGIVEKAVRSINEFMEVQNKSSKFVLHDGLDKYYVRLVDSKTEEVIKEIPPKRLLDAFYEMQKLAGMIVDEKI